MKYFFIRFENSMGAVLDTHRVSKKDNDDLTPADIPANWTLYAGDTITIEETEAPEYSR